MKLPGPSRGAVLAMPIALFLLSVPCRAVDVWTVPAAGLLHLHRTTIAPAEFHALIVDLRQPGAHIRVTPHAERWKTTSGYAIDANLDAAINAGQWSLFEQRVVGLAASGGDVWSPEDRRQNVFAVSGDNSAGIRSFSQSLLSHRSIEEGVGGIPLLVEAGHIAAPILRLEPGRDARAAVGTSKDGKTVFLVTVDGRQDRSVGASLDELAALLIELGADRAVNLDGGNSVTMYVAGEGGVVNRPSRGWERETVTHIGVSVPDLPPVIAVEPARARAVAWRPTERGTGLMPPARIVETPAAAQLLAARSIPPSDRGARGRLASIWFLDRLKLGQAREWLVPGAILALPLVAALWMGVLLQRALSWLATPAGRAGALRWTSRPSTWSFATWGKRRSP